MLARTSGRSVRGDDLEDELCPGTQFVGLGGASEGFSFQEVLAQVDQLVSLRVTGILEEESLVIADEQTQDLDELDDFPGLGGTGVVRPQGQNEGEEEGDSSDLDHDLDGSGVGVPPVRSLDDDATPDRERLDGRDELGELGGGEGSVASWHALLRGGWGHATTQPRAFLLSCQSFWNLNASTD